MSLGQCRTAAWTWSLLKNCFQLKYYLSLPDTWKTQSIRSGLYKGYRQTIFKLLVPFHKGWTDIACNLLAIFNDESPYSWNVLLTKNCCSMYFSIIVNLQLMCFFFSVYDTLMIAIIKIKLLQLEVLKLTYHCASCIS